MHISVWKQGKRVTTNLRNIRLPSEETKDGSAYGRLSFFFKCSNKVYSSVIHNLQSEFDSLME